MAHLKCTRIAQLQGHKLLRGVVAANLARLTDKSTRALLVHAGRCAEIAKPLMPPGDAQEIEPFLGLLSKTAGSFIVEHSEEMFRLSLRVSGIPDVGDLVARLVTEEMRGAQAHKSMAKAVKSKDWGKALQVIETQLKGDPDNAELIAAKCKVLALGKKDQAAATECADDLFDSLKNDANSLNSYAWNMLTDKEFAGKYAEVALKFSERSNELTDYGNWMYVDTLALAKFETGNAEEAVKLEKAALKLCGECWGAKDMKKALAKFEGK